LQRSHRCAQHNAGRNAHNLENAFAVQLGKALTPKEVIFVGDIPKNAKCKSDVPDRTLRVSRRKSR
jgi:hypothetical protein